ncbi:MAG TPA: YidC/Oxa1 family membrane protein insertase [Acidimicrobiales bacterium]|nr:YidC/Oxa1 family membrane protein insertase [Acidimicrobiales bacterium]
MSILHAVPAAENSLFHLIGQIFHPVFVAVAYVLAAIYAVIPNYAVAIILLTILIMALLTPLTVKSTKSMVAMQQIQPEIKKLQQKYRGPENRQQLNEELMRLYRERGINPAGSCLPMFLQMPFLIVLYDVIRGLANTVARNGHVVVQPRYIPSSSRMYHDLVQSHGQMHAFGMDLALRPFSHHATWYGYIPYFVLIALAVVLQYVQMAQMNRRNSTATQAGRQMLIMQRVMPIIFAYIYFLIPAAVVLYMIVSTIIRIITQDVLFRTGMVQLPGSPTPRQRASGRPKGIIAAASHLLEDRGKPKEGARGPESAEAEREAAQPSTGRTAPGGEKAGPQPALPRTRAGGTQTRAAARPANGKGNGRKGALGGGTTSSTTGKPHPRSKSKRARRAR